MTAPPADESRLTQLMVAYQGGDAGAFEQLYAILSDEVRRHFARNHRERRGVNDLVQDLFLEIHRSRRSYAPPLPVRPWVYGIAHNISARARRAAGQQPWPSGAPDVLAEIPAPAEPLSDSLDIEQALTALPANTRDPWLLHHVFGFSFDSIARRLGITVMAAKLRSSRATRALKLALQPKGKSR
ncbi:MAG TPA: RNA polymerase sigma factor [Steroidobacteraceae bacterium]|nr:RNA polymerase sigma factor [Steroidobacteraceae bacterium]